jgi:hypothetical protein
MAKLTVNEAVGGFTDKLAFDYVDLQTTGFLSTLGAANQRIVGKLPPGGYIDLAMLYQVVDPAGATDLTIDFGTTSGDPDELLDNGDVDGATQVIVNTGDALKQSTTGATLPIVGYANDTTSTKSLYMEFNGTLSSLTAGSWVLCWRQANPPTA